ncbi:HNH endonuclease [Massilia sp. erpn]|uniref:HNH endonuclease n=1 Tax=Massilia sp. erpn TaxID=2738142 RepID=UPI0021057A3C|nr:HNH endonuclease [Massilia sp. erpn]UTY57396.1 hypothetical protein HPQ68_09440 [Massilia sp. erpn]
MQEDFDCLYCGKAKEGKESSLEHAIPQFMGGDSAPQHFHLSNVCATCNNRLGLFVDASYAKSWFLTNTFAMAARSLCTQVADPGIPLTYIGPVDIPNLEIPEEHIAESWIGPSGETVIWIRKHDERMNSYAGGNPISAKKAASVAYFFPVTNEELGFRLGWKSFQRAFAKRSARKIIGAQLVGSGDDSGADLAYLMFDEPGDVDTRNVLAIRTAIGGGFPGKIPMNLKFSQRFMCKMALAVGYGLFGGDFLLDNVALEARKGLWPNEEAGVSTIRGTDPLRMMNMPNAALLGYPGAVVVLVMNVGNKWCLTVSVDEKMPFNIELGSDALASPHVSREEGYVLMLFPYLDKAFEMTLAELLVHRLGVIPNAQLQEIDNRRQASVAFWEDLSKVTPEST